jgi:hypothetical protein
LFLTKAHLGTILHVSLATLDRLTKAKKKRLDKEIKIGQRVLLPASILLEIEGQAKQLEQSTKL